MFFSFSLRQCREPGSEQKFKEISNAYEVKTLILITSFHPLGCNADTHGLLNVINTSFGTGLVG